MCLSDRLADDCRKLHDTLRHESIVYAVKQMTYWEREISLQVILGPGELCIYDHVYDVFAKVL